MVGTGCLVRTRNKQPLDLKCKISTPLESHCSLTVTKVERDAREIAFCKAMCQIPLVELRRISFT